MTNVCESLMFKKLEKVAHKDMNVITLKWNQKGNSLLNDVNIRNLNLKKDQEIQISNA